MTIVAMMGKLTGLWNKCLHSGILSCVGIVSNIYYTVTKKLKKIDKWSLEIWKKYSFIFQIN